uniref:DUF2177 family protein n=1 Tax=viral metagenome TaxID=1070528 RepID=A0A6C0E7V2_9ZZZZ
MDNLKIIKGIFILLLLDLSWIWLFMNSKYQSLVKDIQKEKLVLNVYSAGMAYFLMIVGLIMIVIKYDLSYIDTFIFGVVVYGVYDFTCGAIFKEWDFKLAIIDVLWGGFVFTATKYLIDRKNIFSLL